MKSTELITGSWVNYNKKNKKVTTISNANVLLQDCIEIVYLSELKCIPLTTEILDKNFGVSNVWDGDFRNRLEWELEDSFDSVTGICYDQDKDEFTIIDSFDCHTYAELEYVHQLQQWLNVLGIEKEIKL